MSQRASSQTAQVAGLLAMGLCFLASCDGSDPADKRPGGQPPGAASESQEASHVDDKYAGAWLDVAANTLGPTEEWTNNVEAADIDADGDVDLLFANSGDERYWTAVENRVLLNRGDGTFTDATRRVFGKRLGTSRVIRVADVNADAAPDIIVGNIVSSQSRLYLGDGTEWRDVTSSHLAASLRIPPGWSLISGRSGTPPT